MMKKFSIPVFSVFLTLFLINENFASQLSKNDALRLFNEANEKHIEATKLIATNDQNSANKKLAEAALQYETLLANGFINGQVYYNLGNTYYRQGKLGMAILNYKRALRYMPRNAEINANLKLAKGATEDKEIPHEPPVVMKRIFFWLFFMSQNELILFSLAFYILLMVFLFLFLILKYDWTKKLIYGFSIVLFISLSSLAIKLYLEEGIERGIIISKKCEVRYGPGKEYEPKFVVHDGAECVIEQEQNEWYKVYVYIGIKQETKSGSVSTKKMDKEMQMGWLHKKNIETI